MVVLLTNPLATQSLPNTFKTLKTDVVRWVFFIMRRGDFFFKSFFP